MATTDTSLIARLEGRIAAWREEADRFDKHACTEVAVTYRVLADELELELKDWDSTALNITQAATESGYSREHLGRMVREGKLPNAGRPGAPKIRRHDLPIKATPLLPFPDTVDSSITSKEDVVRSVVAYGRGTR